MMLLMASILIHLDFLSIYDNKIERLKKEIASILIHLDFLSIYANDVCYYLETKGFNPYSPGFSIYFRFNFCTKRGVQKASILIHLDFLSI